MALETFGEEVVMRHRIACGDSATFRVNERDIVFLSMVSDSSKKEAQTASHFEQRFNVAMSRARDRLYLVQSVRESQANHESSPCLFARVPHSHHHPRDVRWCG